MMLKPALFPALGALCLLGACATPVGPVEVTRFNRVAEGYQLGQGSVRIVEAPPEAGSVGPAPDSLALQPYRVAVERELQRVGYGLSGSGTDYVAEISVDRMRSDPGVRRSPVSVGVGGSTGSYGGGVGVGIGIDLSGPPKPIISTTLYVRLKRAGDGVVVWEGRALDEAKENQPAAQPGISAGRLAQALFTDFPGRSGETISVK